MLGLKLTTDYIHHWLSAVCSAEPGRRDCPDVQFPAVTPRPLVVLLKSMKGCVNTSEKSRSTSYPPSLIDTQHVELASYNSVPSSKLCVQKAFICHVDIVHI